MHQALGKRYEEKARGWLREEPAKSHFLSKKQEEQQEEKEKRREREEERKRRGEKGSLG